MTTSQSTLEKALEEEEITRIKQEKKEIAAQIRQLNRVLKDFEQKTFRLSCRIKWCKNAKLKIEKGSFPHFTVIVSRYFERLVQSLVL